ncbi:hypothetical protein HYX19_04285 [Candidatus Woesearchaeota archaeon]|nr:hypothetical protein [Candidatus Woesearchaeota archaeon]
MRPSTKILQKDQEEDEAYTQQLLAKCKNNKEIAEKLSQQFSYKYGPEFKGNVLVEFNILNQNWVIRTSDKKNIYAEDIGSIPLEIRKIRS